MDSEQHHYDLRSRSRSRSHTPMLFNQTIESENVEHHYDLRNKESRERSHTPIEVSSSRRSGSRSLPTSGVKLNDLSIGRIVEQREEIEPEVEIEVILTAEKESDKSSAPAKKPERRSERQRVKRQIFANGQEESKDDIEIMDKSEQRRRSVTPKITGPPTSDYSSEEGERQDSPSRPGSAYEIYKQAGDWWNVFPKTDYTYSQTSQCRYEIAPGVLAMPNMSRPAIHSECSSDSSTLSLSQRNSSQLIQEDHSDTLLGEISDTIEQNRLNETNARLLASHNMNKNSSRVVYKRTQVEQFSSHREIFCGDPNILRHRLSFSQVDSDAECDEAMKVRSRSQKKWRINTWIGNIKNVIILLFVNVFQFVNTKILRRSSVASHYSYQESRWSTTWNKIDCALQPLYLFLIGALFLDSWLLSRVSNARRYFLARRSRLIWLMLLPLLLMTGCWLVSYAQGFMASLPNLLPKYVVDEEKLTNSIYYNDKVREMLNINNGATYDEIRQSIALLMERIDKLETDRVNDKKSMDNITDSINETETIRERNTLEFYNKKLSDLEEKVNSKNAEFNDLKDLYAQLKIDCDKNAISLSDKDTLSKDVEQIVAKYFASDVSKENIQKIVNNVLITSNSVIKDTTKSTNEVNNMKEDCEVDCKYAQDMIPLSEERMRKIVKEILKIYDADKTGMVDYALESAGGQIISIRCTQRYNVNTRAFKVLGFTLFYESGDPRTVIQRHSLQPGLCWAFQDFPGYLLIKLRSFILVTGFTLEHAPRSILPNNEIKSAPKRFNVWGLKTENDPEPLLLGDYEFLDNDESLQYFPVQNRDITEPYEYVELRIHSNHGQLEYTCLYRFRVHGIPR